ncbi:hypothetical protein JOD57_004784 [Geodermatophilus bullaregiensis]|uniref:DUF6529 family protein n=1 Tax=Geodermatophilus bullaregiensis TaxID=1564160 RepID=UPI00195D4CDC|nr:DUF6529 family protein [Geodermatophilus bullaregiensis]MBM7808947.1 hypothetical protein [Geodermatophilus bullaregiensis]
MTHTRPPVDTPAPPPGAPAPEPPAGAVAPRPRLRAEPRDAFRLPLLTFLLAGCAVALVLGVYAAEHEPAGYSLDVPGFSSPLYVKAWLTTAAAVAGVVQLLTAARMHDAGAPPWTRTAHRWSGRLAVVLTVPVVVHCVYALGFQAGSTRALVHSALGCFFYGVFVTKMLALTRRGLPRWVVPVLGGAVFTGLIGLWLTSSLWVFTSSGFRL